VEALHAEDVLVLRDPTAPELLREMARHDVVHLATHGSFRSDNPAFSRLSAKEGAVFLADILDTPLSAELVSLSACGTGQVFSGRGDDLIGVAHAFLAAGARQLLASLWRVHDRATNELMSAFYQSYAGEAWGDPAAALRTAARAVRDRRDHPFYWGGFCVYGA
jgi:CHAT domain-containing protein